MPYLYKDKTHAFTCQSAPLSCGIVTFHVWSPTNNIVELLYSLFTPRYGCGGSLGGHGVNLVLVKNSQRKVWSTLWWDLFAQNGSASAAAAKVASDSYWDRKHCWNRVLCSQEQNSLCVWALCSRSQAQSILFSSQGLGKVKLARLKLY